MCRAVLSSAESVLEKVNQQVNHLESVIQKLQPQTLQADEMWTKNKIRQFNAIRNYLNPTMVALLRMDMFGGRDYAYRADERQVSKEMFAKSPQMYEHMRNKWRFSLPPKEMLEEWNDNDDELL